MARRRPRKRRRGHAVGTDTAAAAEGFDCFSDLNEDLLRTILSLLSTRSAATLAAVSRHFRAKVPLLLDRVDSLTLHEPNFPLALRAAQPLLLRRLAIAPHRHVPPWSFRSILAAAAEHGVSELSFRLARRAQLPKNVLFVRSLSVLILDKCAVPPWSDVAYPCLRTLKLNRVAICQETINKVLASASCLETLEMYYCTGLGTGKAGGCTVESSSVRNLVFKPPLKQGETVIRASGLRTVTLYKRGKTKRLELAPAPEVRKAYLHIPKSPIIMESFNVRPFLDAGTRLECLTLRGHAMKLLSSEYEDISRLMVMFQNLRILSVSLDLTNEQEHIFLLKLLESCSNLQKFSISATKPDNNNAVCGFTDHKERLANISCLTASLVQFEFLGFKPQEYQRNLIVFLLNQAKNLKKVGVEFEKSEAAVVKEILSVRRAPIERTSTYYTNYYMELEYS